MVSEGEQLVFEIYGNSHVENNLDDKCEISEISRPLIFLKNVCPWIPVNFKYQLLTFRYHIQKDWLSSY